MQLENSPASTDLVDTSKFLTGRLKTKNGFIPRAESDQERGSYGALRREMIRSTFQHSVLIGVRRSALNDHERWVAAVSHWIGVVDVLRSLITQSTNGEVAKSIAQFSGCYPPGYSGLVWSPREVANHGGACHNRLCPFCHARRSIDFYDRLVAGFGVIPKALRTEHHLVHLSDADCGGPVSIDQATRNVRALDVHGATGFRYPVDESGGEVLWGYDIVAIVDKEQLRRLPANHQMPYFGQGVINLAIQKWIPYPRRWTSKIDDYGVDTALVKALKLDAKLAGRPKSVVHYGACMNRKSAKSPKTAKPAPQSGRKADPCPPPVNPLDP